MNNPHDKHCVCRHGIYKHVFCRSIFDKHAFSMYNIEESEGVANVSVSKAFSCVGVILCSCVQGVTQLATDGVGCRRLIPAPMRSEFE